jgi:hypothetical protein
MYIGTGYYLYRTDQGRTKFGPEDRALNFKSNEGHIQATTLCGSWPPPWFRNSKFFRGGVFSPTPNPKPGGPGTTLRLALTL